MHRSFANVLLFYSAAAFASAAEDPHVVWTIDGDSPSQISSRGGAQLDACLSEVARHTSVAPGRQIALGIYTDKAGRPTDIAVLETSGNEAEDHRVVECFRQGRLEPLRGPSSTSYRIFRIAFPQGAHPPVTQCAASMEIMASIGVTIGPGSKWSDAPAGTETVVCACLNQGDSEPSSPVLLHSSGVPEFDQAVIEYMKDFTLKHWKTPMGCAAWKIRKSN